MRSPPRKWFHIGPRLGLLLVALLWGTSLAGGCLLDVASQALLAPVVIEATVLGPVRTEGPIRHSVHVRVDKVYKGPVKDKAPATLHFFGSEQRAYSSSSSASSSSRNYRNHGALRRADARDACALLLPRAFEKGRKYIVFANVSASDNNFTVHSVPALQNKTSSRLVRKILCKDCAFAPSLTGFKKHVRVNESMPLKLVCKFAGRPPPKIQWFRNGEIVKPMNHVKIVTNKKRSSLTIEMAKPRDGGVYECRATNVIGPPVSMKTKVKVVVVKPPTTTPPRTIEYSRDQQPCDSNIAKEFCHNGGKCFIVISLNDMYCVCQPGYEGNRCGSKVVDHVPENREENMCDTNILTYVVVILGVILFVTILGNLAYFILRKKRKTQKKKTEASARRRRQLSGEALEHIISKGDTIEMARFHQENANKSQHELSSGKEQDDIKEASFTKNSEIQENPSRLEMEPDSGLDSSHRTPPQPKLGQNAARKRHFGVSELFISESSSAIPAPSPHTEPSLN